MSDKEIIQQLREENQRLQTHIDVLQGMIESMREQRNEEAREIMRDAREVYHQGQDDAREQAYRDSQW